MIVEYLDDEGNVVGEDDTRLNCHGGDDTCGGCFRCALLQYPDIKWREKAQVAP